MTYRCIYCEMADSAFWSAQGVPMKQKIQFSIITPVYNCKRYLRKSICSVINQTYSDWELILIDDGSIDGSGEICEEYAAKDRRITAIRKKNEGAMRARLAGIALARGDYLIGMDADDWFDPNALEEIIAAINKAECDIISFGWRTDTKQVNRIPLREGIYEQKAFLNTAILNTDHSLCNKAIKMSCVKNARLIVPDHRLSINADYLHIIPILCWAQNIYVTKKILYNYRTVSSSMTHHIDFKNITDTVYVSDKVLTVLKRERILDDNMRSTVYVAHLKMTGRRLRSLMLNEEITDSELKDFQKTAFYRQCKKYEGSEQILPEDRLFFLLLRRGNFTLIRFLWKRGKNLIPVICRVFM